MDNFNILSSKKVTKQMIDDLFWLDGKITEIKYDDELFYDDYKVVTFEIQTKINEMIDFHNRLKDKYSKGDDTCNGCKLCDEITRLGKLLEHPALRKNTHSLGDPDFPRFETLWNLKIAEMPIEWLAILLHDFKFLKSLGFTNEHIRKDYYIIGDSQFKQVLKLIRNSEYAHVIGK